MSTTTQATPATRSARATLSVRQFACAASGAAVFTTLALGYWLAIKQGELPMAHPWPLVSWSGLGLVLCAWAFREKPLGPNAWIVMAFALVGVAFWFSSLVVLL